MLAGLRVGCAPMAIHTKVPAALSAHSSWLGQNLLVGNEDNLVAVDHLGLGMGSFSVDEIAALVLRSLAGIKMRGVQRGIVAADRPGHAPGGYHV